MIYAPIDVGGRAILDVKSRNEAIELMWLRTYLNFGPDRPLWAQVMDALMAFNVPGTERNVPMSTRVNTFLQSWKTMKGTKAPKSIQKMFKITKAFGVRPEGIEFDLRIRREMPMWYHCEANPQIRRLNH